jgi:hypothetical protein
LYSSTLNSKRANAIFLACAWQVLELNRSPEEAFRGFAINDHNSNVNANDIATAKNTAALINNKSNRSMSSSNPPILPLSSIGKQTIADLPPFHDASPYRCTYELTLMDCLSALVKARQFDFFDWGDKFDVKEYEHFEQVEVRMAEWILQRIYDEKEFHLKACDYYLFFRLLLRPTRIYSFFLRFKIKLCPIAICMMIAMLTTEWRFELDRQGQDTCLCWALLCQNCYSGGLLHVESR